MGADGGLAFIPVHPDASLDEAYAYLRPFFTFDAKGSDWGDDSRSQWYEDADTTIGHSICVPYGTDIYDGELMADDVMDFVWFLRSMIDEIGLGDRVTFADILLEKQTRPTWMPIDNYNVVFYRAIEEAPEDSLAMNVNDWLDGLEKVLAFHDTKWGTAINVWHEETWT